MKLRDRLLSILLTVCLLMTLIPQAWAVNNTASLTASVDNNGTERESVSGSSATIYELIFHGSAPGGIKLMNVVFSYDTNKIVPVQVFSTGPNSGKFVDLSISTQQEKTCFEVLGYYDEWQSTTYETVAASWHVDTDNSRTGCAVAVSTTGTVEYVNGQDMLKFTFRLADGVSLDDLDAGSIKIETQTDSPMIIALYPDENDRKFGVRFDSTDETQYFASENSATVSLTYPGSDRDVLTATSIDEGNGLSLAVPTSGSAELKLSVTNTGLDGEYAGNDAVTTWEITETNDTGAVIDKDSGVLKIDNTGRAGTVTVQATTTAGSVTETDTATVSITREASVPGAVEIVGADTIEVPPIMGATNIGNMYTVEVDDQFGLDVDATNVDWSITDYGGIQEGNISINNGQLNLSSHANIPATITIQAKVNAVSGPTTFAAGDTATKEIKLVREESVATKVEIGGDLSADVPTVAEGGSTTINPTATVTDQYGETMTGVPVTWSLSSQPAGISIDSETGKITVTNEVKVTDSAETKIDVTLTAAVDGINPATAQVTITRAASVVNTVELYRGESESESKIGNTDTLIIPATGSKTYTYTAKVLDQFGQEMKNQEITWSFKPNDSGTGVSAENGTVTVNAGATKDSTYTLTATCDDKSASTTITVKDIDITWPTVTIKEDPTYGDTWAEIVKFTGGSASLNNEAVKGDFTLVNTGSPAAGNDQTYSFNFTSKDGK